MKRTGLLLSFLLILTACGPAPTQVATPDIQSTTAAIAGTMVAATQSAQPSPTLKPTDTQTPTTTPTSIPTLTPTLESGNTGTLTPTPDLTVVGVATATAWSGTFAPGNTNGLPTGLLRIENNTGEKEIIVTLSGITMTREQPVYYSYKVTGALNITILWARYQYMVQIPNKRILTGTFGQNSKDKTTMRVDLTKIVITGP
jgi:hypothetical protein